MLRPESLHNSSHIHDKKDEARKSVARVSKIAAIFGCLLWLMAAGFYYRKLMLFETQPGRSAHAPSVWPKGNGLRLDSGKPTLVQFLHPKCSCSRASLEQVAKLQAEFPKHFSTVLVVWQPATGDKSWGALPMPVENRLAIDQIVWDRAGRIATQFDAHTSGQTYIYNPDGRLRFAGGVTSVRASAIPGPALAMLEAVFSAKSGPTYLPVFGCGF